MSKAPRADTKAIEKKFDETAFRLSQERSDFLLPQILDFVRERKWLNLRPEYQRRLVWDDAKRSLFIESLLLNRLPVFCRSLATLFLDAGNTRTKPIGLKAEIKPPKWAKYSCQTRRPSTPLQRCSLDRS